MAADVNDIVCLGYGSWSSVNSLPTLGFGISAGAAAVSGPYRIAAAHLHVAGGMPTHLHQAGGEHAHVHVPGATKAIVTAG